jgi:hypothetical protein
MYRRCFWSLSEEEATVSVGFGKPSNAVRAPAVRPRPITGESASASNPPRAGGTASVHGCALVPAKPPAPSRRSAPLGASDRLDHARDGHRNQNSEVGPLVFDEHSLEQRPVVYHDRRVIPLHVE